MNKRVGAAAAWVDAVETFGSGKLTVAEVLAPAIRLAEEGSVILSVLLIAKFINYS
jgi:gamma-glutamyltranspeptidase